MSEDDVTLAAPAPVSVTADQPSETRPKYKSWRKKYRKMKARFDDIMKVNSNMFKEEQKLEALAKRLQEQNDQLLDIALDLNSSIELPPKLRFNIKWRPDRTEIERISDLESANRALYEANRLAQEGRIAHAEVVQLRASLERHLASSEAVALSSLENEVPYPTFDRTDPNGIVECADDVAYLTSAHEAEYLERLDAKYGDPLTLSTAPPKEKSPPPFASMTAREVEREVELRNPLSVHNWLKKHNININEAADDKSDAGTPATGKKGGRNLAKKVGDRAVERAREREDGSPMSTATGGPELEDDLDEGPPRGRRARDPDESYRPKGGRSGKSKRKREDGEPRGASKKPKTSIGGASDAYQQLVGRTQEIWSIHPMPASTSPSPPPVSDTKKRKRSSVPAEELEVDVNLPEPPSKKALRRAKKGKSSSGPKASLNDVSDLVDEAPNSPAPGPSSDSPTDSKPARSPHGIWIGNLTFTTTPLTLRHFLTTTASLSPTAITRINLPLSQRPLLPIQARQILTKTTDLLSLLPAGTPRPDAPKYQNKGFAYIDLDSAESLFLALQATETLLDGRKVLIKDANNFEGRPAPTPTTSTTTPANTAVKDEKPRSKKVFVGNLSFDVTREDLERHFGQAGEVEDAFVATFEDTGKCKGFGWVRFGDEEAAERAVRGWVWKTEGGDEVEVEDEEIEEALKGTEDGDEDGDSGEESGEAKGKRRKELSAPKKRKWWINKLNGRMLRCEYAEDASTRYKKRFGKGRRTDGEKEGYVAGGAGQERAYPPKRDRAGDDSRPKRTKGTSDERAEMRRKKHRDARTIAPGAALANAPRQSGAIVQSKGKKVTFD
ncbi:RNA-binding protein rnp24 [Sphaceloma murrayae]|uniref:RNA-binding protein rnp24 n=1 Tax=Sphaceloma murrayae TaxID=2082308 RepID=A0A2K1QZ35_9PEZI|nr:RNA-binding protein rnp24 [Sphaceloma murrayae]